jgi:hypothetical protein
VKYVTDLVDAVGKGRDELKDYPSAERNTGDNLKSYQDAFDTWIPQVRAWVAQHPPPTTTSPTRRPRRTPRRYARSWMV